MEKNKRRTRGRAGRKKRMIDALLLNKNRAMVGKG